MDKQILRITTIGNVDSGKSTLLGRILYETKCVYEDQLETVKKISEKKGGDIDLSLLLDGLASEREQSITIDVAYRYFETEKRKFIVADNPGHQCYTRNMVTGASVSDVAIVMIDAKDGLKEQSKRHIFITSLLQIKYLFVVVNKMDIVNYSEKRFMEIISQYDEFSEKLNFSLVTFIPVSALNGDNIITKSKNTPWYKDKPLLYQLENNNFHKEKNNIDFRFPVQLTVKTDDTRWYLGTISSGNISKGTEVIILPNKEITKIKEVKGDKAAIISLEDEIDVGRGSMIVRKQNIPYISNQIDCYLCVFSDIPIQNKNKYILKHTTQSVTANIDEIIYEIDINNLHSKNVDKLEKNSIGRVKVSTMNNIFFDTYKENKTTGSFILIDQHTYETVAAGIIKKDSTNNTIRDNIVNKESRERKQGHKSGIFYLENLKESEIIEIEQNLFNSNYNIMICDSSMSEETISSIVDIGFIVLHNLKENPSEIITKDFLYYSSETNVNNIIQKIKDISII